MISSAIVLALVHLAAPVEGTSHLFVDDVLVARKSGVVRHAHACRKLPQPVIVSEMPWEQDGDDKRVYLYGTVIRDPESGRFRMWYNRLHEVLLAESDDGLHWLRPNLGLHEHAGSNANNIVLSGVHSPSVAYRPGAERPEFRYAMIGAAKGYHFLHSSDGVHWERCSPQAAFTGGDTCTLTYDARTGEYLAFHKRSHEWRGKERRLVYLASSRDLSTWSDPVLAVAPDEADDAQVRREGGAYAQFYNMSAFPAGGQFLGLLTHFRYRATAETAAPGQSRQDGPIDVQLTHSRDGRNWARCEDRTPVIPNGPYPYDAGCILGAANGPVIVGDECWLYYTAITGTHGAPLDRKQISIALAKWRRDGFVSLDAEEGEGYVETVPLALSGAHLTVNAEVTGSLRVALLNPAGQPLGGYGYEDCQALTGDSVRHAVHWSGHDRLPEQAKVCLAFRMDRAKLYSFTAGGIGLTD